MLLKFKKIIFSTIVLLFIFSVYSFINTEEFEKPTPSPSPQSTKSKQEKAMLQPAQSPKKTANDFFADARKVSETQPKEAIQFYQQGLLLNPQSWDDRLSLATLLEKQGRTNEAMDQYKLIVEKSPSVKAFVGYSRLLGNAGYLNDSAIISEQGATKFSNDIEMLKLAGERLLAVNSVAKAIEYFNQAINQNPKDANLQAAIGTAYEKSGKFVLAYKSYSYALVLDKSHLIALAGKKRLNARSMIRPEFTIILPEQWRVTSKGISDTYGLFNVEIVKNPQGNPSEIAKKIALQGMPAELFTSDALSDTETEIARITKTFKDITREQAASMLNKLNKPVPKLVLEEVSQPIPSVYAGATITQLQDGKEVIMQGRHTLVIKTGDTTTAFVLQQNIPIAKAKAVLLGLLDGLVQIK